MKAAIDRDGCIGAGFARKHARKFFGWRMTDWQKCMWIPFRRQWKIRRWRRRIVALYR